MAAPAMHPLLALVGTLGDAASTAAQAAQAFNVSDYIPQDVQDDYAQGKAYYDTFSQAAASVSFQNGTIQLSPAAQEAVYGALTSGLSAAAPPLGVALALIWAVAPHAGAGPGDCVNPPAGPALDQLRAWPHFNSWQAMFGSYGPDAPGSFEAFANPVLEYNYLLGANCFSSASVPADQLLAKLIASWNVTHQGPARTIERTFDHINSFGANPNYDPIADGLYWSIVYDPQYQGPAGAFGPQYVGPDQASRSFQVNTGPMIAQKVLPLVLHGGSTPAATTSKGAAVATGIGIAGAAAAAVWAATTGRLASWLKF